MLRENTAFTLYALYSYPYDTSPDRIREIIAGQRPVASFPRHAQSRLANPSGRLRFCPKCAKEQEKLYGESYWQVLPQLDEAEYCPVHKIPIRNTSIPIKSIRRHFYPASSVLKDPLLSSATDYESNWKDLFEQERELFISVSQNINWLLHNGLEYEGFQKLKGSYARAVQKAYHVNCWHSMNISEFREALPSSSRNHLLSKYLKTKNPPAFYGNNVYILNFKICSHVLFITALCGHPKVFYQ